MFIHWGYSSYKDIGAVVKKSLPGKLMQLKRYERYSSILVGLSASGSIKPAVQCKMSLHFRLHVKIIFSSGKCIHHRDILNPVFNSMKAAQKTYRLTPPKRTNYFMMTPDMSQSLFKRNEFSLIYFHVFHYCFLVSIQSGCLL